MRKDVLEMLNPALLDRIADVAARFGNHALLIGAAAFALSPAPLPRLTLDVDFAVNVPSWDAFDALGRDLVRRGLEVSSKPCRYIFGGQFVDVIPYGAIEEDGTIVFPKSGERFTVRGLHEVYAAARQVDIEGRSLRVATLPGIFILKTFAFFDRRRREDIQDILTIIDHYQTATSGEMFFGLLDSNPDLLFEEAGAWGLGRDVGRMCEADTLAHLVSTLDMMLAPESSYRALLPRRGPMYHEQWDEDLEKTVACLRLVARGAANAHADM